MRTGSLVNSNMSEKCFLSRLSPSPPVLKIICLNETRFSENFRTRLWDRSIPVHGSVPASSQREVDDHVHWNEVGHGVVVGPHGAQDPLSRLEMTTATV